MSMTTFYGSDGAIIKWNGISIYPRGYHIYGQDIASANARHENADILISLMDAWVCSPELLQQNNTRWVPWFPVDSEPLPGPVKACVMKAYKRIVYSRYAEKMCAQADLDCYYVPHGIDTKIYHPMDKAEARRKSGLPNDAYIIGMVAANKGMPARKNFVEQIAAFRGFKQRHKDAVLYLHTAAQPPEGLNIPEYIENIEMRMGIDIIFPDQHRLQVGGYSEADMNVIYNSFDVLSSVSMGEGFGIPIVEAQACGVPVIVGDWTSMGELCFSGHKVLKSRTVPYYGTLGSFYYIPYIADIEALYEAEYKKPSSKTKAREGALAYDADKVTAEYWLPVLADIEKSIGDAGTHTHVWSKIAYVFEGTTSTPCIGCYDELVNGMKIIKDGFKPKFQVIELKFVPDTDGITKIVSREVAKDYAVDNLGIGPQDTVIDIGAHVGIVSCYLAKRYGCKVVAYEPVKANFDKLLENAKLNGVTIEAINKAVTADGRMVKIQTVEGNSGGATILGGTGMEVESVAITDVLRDGCALLKIDCEGAEFEILPAAPLEKVKRLRGEFHAGGGNMDALEILVRQTVPDVKVTRQGL